MLKQDALIRDANWFFEQKKNGLDQFVSAIKNECNSYVDCLQMILEFNEIEIECEMDEYQTLYAARIMFIEFLKEEISKHKIN